MSNSRFSKDRIHLLQSGPYERGAAGWQACISVCFWASTQTFSPATQRYSEHLAERLRQFPAARCGVNIELTHKHEDRDPTYLGGQRHYAEEHIFTVRGSRERVLLSSESLVEKLTTFLDAAFLPVRNNEWAWPKPRRPDKLLVEMDLALEHERANE